MQFTPVQRVTLPAGDEGFLEEPLAPVGRPFNDLGLGPIDLMAFVDRVLCMGRLLRL